MNDIRLRPLAIFFGWRLWKNHSPKPVKLHSGSVRLTPFFRPCIWSLKMWWSDVSLDGVLPQNETRSLGFTCHRWGVSFRFGFPCFSLSSLDAHQDKTKSTAPRFTLVDQSLCHKTSLWLSAISHRFTVSLHDVKNAPEARKTVLNFQRRFGCFIGWSS